ncbi:hypothetical protein HY442_01045 [Candidatus Parcubacteria bacterium]|nr:hypothetical protein [Candidatus Parcubacteria bacterium]MBI4385580.1 hypothetical protein [Candidatus Parcubacteria bacterium]
MRPVAGSGAGAAAGPEFPAGRGSARVVSPSPEGTDAADKEARRGALLDGSVSFWATARGK